MSSNNGHHPGGAGGKKSGSDDVAISVRGLSKSYNIARNDAAHTRITEAIMDRMRRPFARPQTETFWALRDVNFDIARGEVVGVIGRNGAGKSTLLKVLSRITAPTSGEVHLRGRVGSLLEVGTGFHPELTGRENVYLNGAILGMTRGDINRQFDAIVDFAETEKFLDTPVKRYSSGMYVRLAFAVAAHLNPEILIVDEVLAVGDAEFQKKCLGKMQDVASSGRTVLFVSHNIGAITALCTKALLLVKGEVGAMGLTADVVTQYQSRFVAGGVDGQSTDLRDAPRTGSGAARFTSLRVQASDAEGQPLSVATPGCNLHLKVCVEAARAIPESSIGLYFTDANGYRLIDISTFIVGKHLRLEAGESGCVTFEINNLLLRPGLYNISAWLGRHDVEETDHVEYGYTLNIEESATASNGQVRFPGPYSCLFDAEITTGGRS